MRQLSTFVAILCFPILTLAEAPLHKQVSRHAIPDNYIAVLRPDISPTKVQTYYTSMHGMSKKLALTGHAGVKRTYENIQGLNAFHIECDVKTLEDIRKHPHIAYVATEGFVRSQSPLTQQTDRTGRRDMQGPGWDLARMSHRVPGSSEYISVKPPGTILYSLDTGIMTTHEQFSGRAIWGANFVDGSPNVDENGHGTHTAATAAGNTVGVDNKTIVVAVKCLDKNSGGTWSGVMAAIDWAVGDAQSRGLLHRSVINMSIGGPAFQPIDDMIGNATAQGTTIVVAASNYGADANAYSPARAPAAITVGAIDRNDVRPDWSNYGSAVDIFAPGTDISSAFVTGVTSYVTLSGTSMAAPHIAGLATYLMSREGLSGPSAVRTRMMQLATKNKVQNARGSANLIAFNGADETF